MSMAMDQGCELTEFAEDFGLCLSAGAVETQEEEEQEQIREDKVFAIRRQLAEGIYDIDDRLNAILDRLLAAF